MELPLQLKVHPAFIRNGVGFNPCFNGTTSATFNVQSAIGKGIGFNPCFNGTTSATH